MDGLRRSSLLVVLLSILYFQGHVAATGSAAKDEKSLIRTILYDYENRARPVLDSRDAVDVKFSVTPIQIADLDEVNQVFSISVWLAMIWKDERLKWDPLDFNNLTKILLPEQSIWLPDIVLYNSDDFKTLIPTNVVVQHTGDVFWGPPTKYYSSCQVNVKYFPFDVQKCKMKFGSWMYDGGKLELDILDRKLDTKNYLENGEWSLVNISMQRQSVVYDCCSDPYYFVTYEFVIKRRVVYYMLNIVMPCLWLSILSVMTFRLPPDSGEKISLGITVLLAFSVFSLLIAESMPRTSESIPLIGVYLSMSILMTSISIIMTIQVLHLHHVGPRQRALPAWAQRFFFERVAKYLGMRGIVQDFIHIDPKRKDIESSVLNPNSEESRLLLCSQIIKAISATGDVRQLLNSRTKSKSSSISENGKVTNSKLENGFDQIPKTRLPPELEKLLKRQMNNLENEKRFQQDQTNIGDEWRLLAIILDRFFFWIYLLTATSISGVLLLVTPILGEWYSAQEMKIEKHVLLE